MVLRKKPMTISDRSYWYLQIMYGTGTSFQGPKNCCMTLAVNKYEHSTRRGEHEAGPPRFRPPYAETSKPDIKSHNPLICVRSLQQLGRYRIALHFRSPATSPKKATITANSMQYTWGPPTWWERWANWAWASSRPRRWERWGRGCEARSPAQTASCTQQCCTHFHKDPDSVFPWTRIRNLLYFQPMSKAWFYLSNLWLVFSFLFLTFPDIFRITSTHGLIIHACSHN